MRHFFLLLIILLPSAAISQTEKSRGGIQSMGIIFAPGFSHHTLNYARSYAWIANTREEELGNFAFTASANLRFCSRRKLQVETGLLYSNQSLKTAFEVLTWVSDVPDLPIQSKTIYRFKYLVAPVSIRHNFFANAKTRFFAKTGISATVFLSRKTTVITASANSDECEHASSKQVGNSRFGVAASITLGMDYNLSDKLVLSAEPFYQRFLTSMVADRHAKEYLFSFGVGIGLNYLL